MNKCITTDDVLHRVTGLYNLTDIESYWMASIRRSFRTTYGSTGDKELLVASIHHNLFARDNHLNLHQ